jgi:hypothetical protein
VGLNEYQEMLAVDVWLDEFDQDKDEFVMQDD